MAQVGLEAEIRWKLLGLAQRLRSPFWQLAEESRLPWGGIAFFLFLLIKTLRQSYFRGFFGGIAFSSSFLTFCGSLILKVSMRGGVGSSVLAS